MRATNDNFQAHVSTWSPNDTTQILLFGGATFCVFCSLMSGEQTEIVSNPYTTYYSVRSSLRKIGNDLWLHLVLICNSGLQTLLYKDNLYDYTYHQGKWLNMNVKEHSKYFYTTKYVIGIKSLCRDCWKMSTLILNNIDDSL